MVTCQLTGGFGNQLCQVSAVIAYARKHAMPLCLPTKTVDPSIWPQAWFSDPSIYHNKLWVKAYEERDWIWHQEPSNQEYKEIPAYPYLQLRGHFQSYKYWLECLPIIKKYLLDDGLQRLRAGICAIHVRRGDYLKFPVKHPTVTMQYLVEAMKYAYNQRGIKQFFLYSDDMQWCRNNLCGVFKRSLDLLGVSITFPMTGSTKQDFISMMSHDHHIISNSSYSLMAAHLSSNPDKMVIAPATWTLEPKQVWNTDHIIPPGWITI